MGWVWGGVIGYGTLPEQALAVYYNLTPAQIHPIQNAYFTGSMVRLLW